MKLIAILLATPTLPLTAQWLSYPDARTPRTKDGKPNLTAPPPRINGKPDLSGVWQAEPTPESEFTSVLGNTVVKLQLDLNDVTKDGSNVFWGPKLEQQALRPEAVAILKQRAGLGSPYSHCLPAGVPAGIFAYAFKMIQVPRDCGPV